MRGRNDEAGLNEPAILCFGDSNTWGFTPVTRARYARAVRWTGVLQHALAGTAHIIEEGLSGRCAVHPDPEMDIAPPLRDLQTCLASHKPLTLTVLMLGTNDCKARFNLTPEEITGGVKALCETVLGSEAGPDFTPPQLLLIAPPKLSFTPAMHPLVKDDYLEQFEGGAAKSAALPGLLRRLAVELGCAFLDAGKLISVSPKDGIHWEPTAHAVFGNALAGMLKTRLDYARP